MRGNFDDDEDQEELKKEIIIPKFTLLFQDMEVEVKNENQEEREEREKEEEEKKPEENEPEEGEDQKKKLTTIERIVFYIAEIMQESTKEKPISDKDLAMKLKEKLDLDVDLIKPSISNEDIEENGVWQVVIGKQFAASVTFDAKYIYYFKLDESRKYFLVFRS